MFGWESGSEDEEEKEQTKEEIKLLLARATELNILTESLFPLMQVPIPSWHIYHQQSPESSDTEDSESSQASTSQVKSVDLKSRRSAEVALQFENILLKLRDSNKVKVNENENDTEEQYDSEESEKEEEDMLEQCIKKNDEVLQPNIEKEVDLTLKTAFSKEKREEILKIIDVVMGQKSAAKEEEDKKTLENQSIQKMLESRIMQLETASKIDTSMISSQNMGDVLLNSVKHCVRMFVADIKSVMKKGMRPKNVQNTNFAGFKALVDLHDRADGSKGIDARKRFVDDFYWKHGQTYFASENNYQRMCCFAYLFFLELCDKDKRIVIPTMEHLVQHDGSPGFQQKEREFLKVVMAQHWSVCEDLGVFKDN
ncbi:hypothetical protein GCK72_025181 [Caenorhabditis remanei]|uniref:Uncharacterized protein n=1 Tax=Caenorhabditis remanei TaxID=31234 RepID=A0A6A5G272_CAERE|nr:hypothetical protein GCK72_025181 [Caenorhabditis remanei]KAF1748714.1 hypothetical protein GCK72_025181 [Caenorhabditis remanei]